MKYNESTESLSSSSLSSSCSEGKINHVISQPKYKSSSLSSSCGEGNVISRVINEPNYKSSLMCTEAKSSSEEPNSSEDDGSPSSVNTSNFKEEKEKQQFVKGKKLSQKGAPCMLARKDSGQLLKGEWPEATSVDGTHSGEAASASGPSDKIKAWVAKQAGGGLRVKEEGKSPLDKEVSNLLLQMLQEHSPPAPTMPQQTTRGLRHEPMILVKSNSVSATKADNILKLDYLCSSAGSNIPTSHNKLGHRLSTGDSPLYVLKRYGSQGPVSLRTGFPSPGTPSRSSFSGVPTAMMNINNKAYMVGRIAVNEGTGKLLPLYNLPPSSDQETINPGRLSVGGFSSRAAPPPSKWDDAGKWLVNASPSHPSQLPPHPSKQANYLNYTESKKNPINNKKVINVVASSSPPFSSHTPGYNTLHTPMDTSMQYQSRSLVPFASPSASDSQMQEELAETMSDSELSNTQEECKVFVRSTSHKQYMKESANYAGKQRNSKSQLARKSVMVNNNKEEQLHHVSSPVTLQLKPGSTNTHLEQLPQMHDVYAVECADGAPCGNDEVVEGAGGGLARLVMQAGKVVGKWGAGAMRDASTDVSPKLSMSRRDMGTQMTPVASSKTSRSATPLKNSSPVRHNTPTRAKQATVSAHSPVRGKVASLLQSSSESPHHLELQNCHLEKLENGHVMCQAGSASSTTSLSTTSHETSSSSWKSLQDNIASENHIHRKDQSSSGQDALKMQESSAAAAQYTAWEEAERSKHMTKCAREEARIDAWESHQKAKAEAEMKKLEMKLERLRAQATEKIMNKVSIAHLRAEEMRAAARAQQAEQLAKSLERANSISRKGGGYFQESLGVCFSLLP